MAFRSKIAVLISFDICCYCILGLPLLVPNSKFKPQNDVPLEQEDGTWLNVTHSSSFRNMRRRSVVSDKSEIWTNGMVPYYIDETFFDIQELSRIKEAFNEFHQKTCIKFFPKTTQTPYLLISPMSKCSSKIGMPKDDGIRILSLGPSCLDKTGTIIHELMHVLGFWHEQNRPDRDNYITIEWDNIPLDMHHNFFKYGSDVIDTLNEPYDYQSIMHYSSHAYASDPQRPTIVPNINIEIGQRIQLSNLDVKKVKKLYGCNLPSRLRPFWPVRKTTTESSTLIEKQHNNQLINQQHLSGGSGFIFQSTSEFIDLPIFWNSNSTGDQSHIIFRE